MRKLSDLKVGEKGYIVKVHGYGGFRKRIVEMGFIKGQAVEVVHKAPFKDPTTFRIMGYEVSLRKSAADQIDIISPEDAQKELFDDTPSYLGTFTEDDFRMVALKKRRNINVALVGNPNSGKSSLFSVLTGEYVKVGNYSGVTVDVKEGGTTYKGYKFTFFDLPGTYSISAFSPEERLVRDHITKAKPDIVLNVVDSGNLERNLYLTTQLVDMNIRSIIAFNFYDEFKKRGDVIDSEALGKLLGIPIVPVSATEEYGITELLDAMIDIYEGSEIIDKDGKILEQIDKDAIIDKYLHSIELEHKHNGDNKNSDLVGDKQLYTIVRHIHINYGKVIEESISRLKSLFNKGMDNSFTPRYIAIQLLQKDKDIEGLVAMVSDYKKIMETRDDEFERVKRLLGTTPSNAIMDAKYGFISGALKETYVPSKEPKKFDITGKIDDIITNKYLAYPIFAVIMYLMFKVTFTLGQYPMDWIEMGIAKLSVWISDFLADGMLKDLLLDGILGGVGAVLVFFPNILILYFCMTILEASGYMARAVFIMDKIMHKIGLHGRSFIPLMMGFGCTVPAIMATRTIENRNSRMITILISSFISCSARLPVYILLVGIFFAKHQALAMFIIYMSGIVVASLFAIIFRKFIFKKDEAPFVMELPKYRLPQVKYVMKDTWDKSYQYLKKIGTTILVGAIIIWALAYFPLGGEDKVQQMENSYLASVGKAIAPVMEPVGFDWKITVAILTGSAAKEIIVSTLGVLYNVQEDSVETALPDKMQTAVDEQGNKIYSMASVVSLIIFVMLYFPCIATIATIKNETNSWLWALFVVAYTTIFAWIMSFVAYNTIHYGIIQETIVAIIVFFSLLFATNKLIKSKDKKCTGNCSSCG